MFGFFKMIIIGIVAFIVIICALIFGSEFNSKDSAINTYDRVIQFLGDDSLTSNGKLKGTREYGVDHYCRNI